MCTGPNANKLDEKGVFAANREKSGHLVWSRGIDIMTIINLLM